MLKLISLALVAALTLAGCASSTGYGYARQQAARSCPAGTVLICMPDTRSYCHCGEFPTW